MNLFFGFIFYLNHIQEENMENNYIVCIGASAGGLEALETFFMNMSYDSNLSFVVIQHLSPDYKSLMAELLSKKRICQLFR